MYQPPVAGSPPPGPPVRGRRRVFDPGAAGRAVETVRAGLPYFYAGPALVRRGPGGEVVVDVPLMYQGFALDRVHYDPVLRSPSPKGRPGRAWGVEVDPLEAQRVVGEALGEAWVLGAAEYREPEDVWVVGIAWKHMVIAHVRVSGDGAEIVPDYHLTGEVQRYAL